MGSILYMFWTGFTASEAAVEPEGQLLGEIIPRGSISGVVRLKATNTGTVRIDG